MMIARFTERFRRNADLSVENDRAGQVSMSPDVLDVINRWGGSAFDDGLYRIVRAADTSAWRDRVVCAFPLYAERISCFAYDWLGRAFAVDVERLEGGRPAVLMFEPGTGQVLEIPCNIASFHDSELIDYRDAALASDFYDRWLAAGGAAPTSTQCVGYKVPLFLGGMDDLSNLELSDIDVYWELIGQLIVKARSLPIGAKLKLS